MKMWKQCQQNITGCRTAMAGSIYMRRASLQIQKANDEFLDHSKFRRNPSFGKIIKNGQQKQDEPEPRIENQNLSFQCSKQLLKRPGPLIDTKNILLQTYYSRQIPKNASKTMLMSMQQPSNQKIKLIQEKYRKMLSHYEKQKKNIDQELKQLKSGRKPPSVQAKTTNFNIEQVHASRIRKNSQPKINDENIIKSSRNQSKQEIKKYSSVNINQTKFNSQKKQVQSKQQISKVKVKNKQKYAQFFKGIKKQIQLQEKLRNTKICMNADHKIEIMKILVQKHNISDEKILEIEQDQFDPFIAQKGSNSENCEQIGSKIVKQMEECDKNWKQNVCVLDSRTSRQIFTVLNFQKTRQISIRGFMRELGLILEKHYRIRDVLKIYKRFQPFTEHNFTVQVCKYRDEQ